MEEFSHLLDVPQLAAWLEQMIVEARDLLDEAVRPWTLFQLALLLVLFAAARLFSGQLYPLFEQRLRHLRQDRRTLRFLVLLLHRLQPILFLLLIWLTVGVMRELTWPSRSFLLGVVASLVAAWLVISIAARLIRNPPLRRIVAGLALAFAALNILGLFQETMAWLDGVAFTLGEARISLLTIGKGLLWLVLLIWAAHSISRALDRRIARLQDLTPSVQVLLGKLLRIVLLAIAIIVPLQAIGIDLTALTIFSGAIGLGLGFGLQKVVSNLISGIILLLDKSIKPGDVISLGQTFGWITSLGARYVSVITRDGREYLIPNEDLITQQVVNWSYSDQLVRLEIEFGVSYGSDPHEVRRIAREAAARPARVAGEPAPVCHLAGFGESSLDFVLRFWIRDPAGGVVNVRGEVLLELWDAFQRAGIAIPYPHREVILRQPIPAAPMGAATLPG